MTLQEHDRIHHPDGYHEGDTCKYRDNLKKETPEDKADELHVEGKGGKQRRNKPSIIDKLKQEIAKVRDAYEGPNGNRSQEWLKAPNGADSNLSEDLWVFVRTPSFKKWFGDWENDSEHASKVLDENGEPMVLYHCSDDPDIKEFIVPWEGPIEWDGLPGLFFSPKPQTAYGKNVYSVFLNIRRPTDMDGKGERRAVNGRSLEKIEEFGKQYEDSIKANEKEFEFSDDGSLNITDKGLDSLKSDGYYGTLAEDGTKEYAVLSPQQVMKLPKNVEGKGTKEEYNPELTPEDKEFNRLVAEREALVRRNNEIPEENKKDSERAQNKEITWEDFFALRKERASEAEQNQKKFNKLDKSIEKMFRQAAGKAMPHTKVVGKDGLPMIVYHGTVRPRKDGFTEFADRPIFAFKQEGLASQYTHSRRDMWVSPDRTGHVIPMVMNLENPYVVDAGKRLWSNIAVDWSNEPVDTDAICKYAKEHGHDGVIIRHVRDNMFDNDRSAGDEYIAFSSNQVKDCGGLYETEEGKGLSHDYEVLVSDVGNTKDNNGNVIPLSRRFDDGYDIRGDVAASEKGDKTEETVDNKPLVTPEEDAAYMEAVEKGDMETAAKMVREAAAKAMPDTKMVGEDGLPRMLYKGKSTDTTEYEGDIYLSNDIGVAKSYVGRYSEDGRGTLMKAFVDMRTPLVIDASGATFDTIPTPQVLLDKYGVGAKIKTDRLYDAEIFSDTMSLDDIVYFAKDAGYDGVEVRDIIDSNNWNEMHNPPRATTYVAFNSRQIKSADPVTYDDHGNVIPLSRRFDDGDDIRGDVSGKTEYIEKMKSLHPDINPNELINRLKGLGSREEMEAEIAKILGKK